MTMIPRPKLRAHKRIRKILDKKTPRKTNVEAALEYFRSREGRIKRRNPSSVLKMKKLARLLLAGFTVRKASVKLGVLPGAVYGWMRDAAFKEYYAYLQDDLFRAADQRFLRTLDEGLDALRKQLKHRDQEYVDRALDKVIVIHDRFFKGNRPTVQKHQHEHTVKGAIAVGEIKDEDLSDEAREHAREFLKLTRKQIVGSASKYTSSEDDDGSS